MFDKLFFNVFNAYKPSLKRKANNIALVYVTVLQILLFVLLGILFRLFCKQMHLDALSSEGAWFLSIVAALFFYFDNWFTYTGKKRMKIKASVKNAKDYNVWVLWTALVLLGLFVFFISQKL